MSSRTSTGLWLVGSQPQFSQQLSKGLSSSVSASALSMGPFLLLFEVLELPAVPKGRRDGFSSESFWIWRFHFRGRAGLGQGDMDSADPLFTERFGGSGSQHQLQFLFHTKKNTQNKTKNNQPCNQREWHRLESRARKNTPNP